MAFHSLVLSGHVVFREVYFSSNCLYDSDSELNFLYPRPVSDRGTFQDLHRLLEGLREVKGSFTGPAHRGERSLGERSFRNGPKTSHYLSFRDLLTIGGF